MSQGVEESLLQKNSCLLNNRLIAMNYLMRVFGGWYIIPMGFKKVRDGLKVVLLSVGRVLMGTLTFRLGVRCLRLLSISEVGGISGRPEGRARGRRNNNDTLRMGSCRFLGTCSVQTI